MRFLTTTSLLTVLCVAPAFGLEKAVQSLNHHLVIEGLVKQGESFQSELPGDLTFFLDGKGPWSISIRHKKFPTTDLVYVINPPYRFSGHLTIGEGFGESAQSSVKNSPREFFFLYKSNEAAAASELISKVLWPKTDAEQETAIQALNGFHRGNGKLEIVSADFISMRGKPKTALEETIRTFKFKVYLDWPKEQ